MLLGCCVVDVWMYGGGWGCGGGGWCGGGGGRWGGGDGRVGGKGKNSTKKSGRYAQHVTTILLLHAIVANKRHARYRARATPWATSPSTLRKLGRKEQLTQLDTVDFDRSFRMVQTARGCGKHPRCV